MTSIDAEALVDITGGQQRPAGPMLSGPTPSPLMTKPPHMGFDAVRQIGPSGGGNLDVKNPLYDVLNTEPRVRPEELA
jgi:hypothetical protein